MFVTTPQEKNPELSKTHNIKIEGTERKIIEYQTNITDRNTRAKTKTKRKTRETQSYQKTKDKIAIGKLHISIITLNVNGLNAPVKRHRGAERIEKTKRKIICCLQETHLSCQDKYRLKLKGWKTIFLAKGIEEK